MKVVNPATGRKIQVGGATYKKLYGGNSLMAELILIEYGTEHGSFIYPPTVSVFVNAEDAYARYMVLHQEFVERFQDPDDRVHYKVERKHDGELYMLTTYNDTGDAYEDGVGAAKHPKGIALYSAKPIPQLV